MKSAIIILYFGKKLPKYFPLFVKSIEHNKEVDVLFYSDLLIDINYPSNFIHKFFTLNDYTNLLKLKTGLNCDIKNPYKICDHRPLFGKIFNDEIKDYDYWGFGDIDLIFGDLNSFFILPAITHNYDVISFRKNWLSGSTCFFKNQENINELYMLSNDYKQVIENDKHYAFDEVSRLSNGNSVYLELEKGKPLLSMKTEIESFTKVIFQCRATINTKFETVIKESIQKGMILKYDYGRISIEKSKTPKFKKGTEFATYHFITEKNKPSFSFPDWKVIPDTFFITKYGFHKSLNELALARFYSIFKVSFHYMKKSIYIRSYKNVFKHLSHNKLPQKNIQKLFRMFGYSPVKPF